MTVISTVDVIVVGAGIVGVSIAAHLGLRGIKAALVDRSEIAAATSFGNLGLVERASLYPPAFPRKLRELARYALNRELDAAMNRARCRGWRRGCSPTGARRRKQGRPVPLQRFGHCSNAPWQSTWRSPNTPAHATFIGQEAGFRSIGHRRSLRRQRNRQRRCRNTD